MKLFSKLGAGQSSKDPNSLVNKCVQCSSFNLMCEESIGAGGYASIYRVRDQATGQTYALKHLRLPPDSDAVAEVRQEMKIMHLLGNHPNILKLHAASFAGPPGKETDAFMVMDYCPTTLLDMMQRSNFQLDDFFIHEVFSEVCHAVAHMHLFAPPYAHRDIKAENVLKTAKGKWVLCDFGSATTKAQVFESPAEMAMEEEVIRRTTTPAYRAPEMWDLMGRQRIDTKVDIWALGVLLYVLVFGKLPFQGDSKLSVLFGKYEMPPGKPQPVCDLIRDMLITDPATRPDILAVISRLDIVKQHLVMTLGGVPASPALPAAMPTSPAPVMASPGPLQAAIPRPVPSNPATPQPHAMQPPTAPYPHVAGQHPHRTHHSAHHKQQPMQPTPQQSPVVGVLPASTAPPSGNMYPNIIGNNVVPTNNNRATPSPPPMINPQAVAGNAGLNTLSPVGSAQTAALHRSQQIQGSQSQPSSSGNLVSIRSGNNLAPHASASHAAAAAFTTLFVPSEGALQLPSGMHVSQPAANGLSRSSLSAETSQKEEQTTATLIEVDVDPPEPFKDPQDVSLLNLSPIKPHKGHRHKRSSSFSNAFDSPPPTFEPDWGEQPAFTNSQPLSSGGKGPSHTKSHPQSAKAAQFKAQQNHFTSPPGTPHSEYVSDSTPAAPNSGSNVTLPHAGSGSMSTPLVQTITPSTDKPAPRHSRHNSRAVNEVLESGANFQSFTSVHSNSNNNAPLPASTLLSSGIQSGSLDNEALRVQVKSLLAAHNSLVNRVARLEETVQEQAKTIQSLQAELKQAGMQNSHSNAADISRMDSKGGSGHLTDNSKAGVSWHKFGNA